MLTIAQRAQPATRRVIDAMRSMASDSQERARDGAIHLPDWRVSLIRGHRKVRDLYREVLATHELAQAERAAIEDRIARIDSELASLDAIHESKCSMKGRGEPHEHSHEHVEPKTR